MRQARHRCSWQSPQRADRRPVARRSADQRGAVAHRDRSGVRRRFPPHQLRHAHAVELLHEGIPLPLIQRQLGHSHLSTTGTYLQGIDTEEVISTIHARRAPMMNASAGLTL
ncbi:MAG TPA: tyrosine-type recombinase/integrase [Solirubrobacteraceae bacterium]